MAAGNQDRVKKITTAGVTTDELVYDNEGRVTQQKRTLLTRSGYPFYTNYTYDSLDRVTSTRLPDQYGTVSTRKLIENTFDTSSRLTTLNVNGQQQAGNIQYNASDQTTSIDIGTGATTLVNEQYTFDPQTGLLTTQQAWRNGTKLLDLAYDYNRNNSVGNTATGKTGQVTKITNNTVSGDHSKDREYQYDALGRLTAAKGGLNSALWSQAYSYDRYGNRTSVAVAPGSVAADGSAMPADGIPNLTYNTANNQITTSNANGQFEYDAAGNQTRALDKDGVSWLRFEYDAANRLVNIKQDNGTLIQTQQFAVGNERIALTDVTASQTTWYAGSTEYIENNNNGVLAWSKSCIYLGDSVLSTITPNGSGGEYTEFNHPDRLGTRLITNQQAGTAYEQNTLPFGTALNAESTYQTNPKRFTSYERSARTDLDYAQNRTYDSKLGRFTQVDPIGIGASSVFAPQTLNLYTYCGNDPINHVDPDGLDFFSWLGHVILSFFRSGVAKRIAIKFVVSFVVSGGNLSVAIRSVAPDILSSLGLSPNLLLTPSWNPNLPHPLSSGGVGSLSRYIIYNFDDDDEIIKVEATTCSKNLQIESPLCPVASIVKLGRWVKHFALGLEDAQFLGIPGWFNNKLAKWFHHKELEINTNSKAYFAGEIVVDIASLFVPVGGELKAGKWGERLFARGAKGILNKNDYIRLGWSFERDLSIVPPTTGRQVFRIGIGSKRSKLGIHWHIRLWPW